MVLQYELADLRERILAYLIDLVAVGFTVLILIGLVSSTFTDTALTVMLVLTFSIFIFYSLLFEVLNQGQTLGKMAMRIQVIKTTSGQATFPDYAARWVFRLVDIYFSLGGIASILIASSSKSQRIGDIVANTTVIKITPKMNLTLRDILALHAPQAYQPEYIQARQLMEEDALLIKSTLDRYGRYRNKAHYAALNKLAERIVEVLNVEPPAHNQIFLQTILKDYVMLTR